MTDKEISQFVHKNAQWSGWSKPVNRNFMVGYWILTIKTSPYGSAAITEVCQRGSEEATRLGLRRPSKKNLIKKVTKFLKHDSSLQNKGAPTTKASDC